MYASTGNLRDGGVSNSFALRKSSQTKQQIVKYFLSKLTKCSVQRLRAHGLCEIYLATPNERKRQWHWQVVAIRKNPEILQKGGGANEKGGDWN